MEYVRLDDGQSANGGRVTSERTLGGAASSGLAAGAGMAGMIVSSQSVAAPIPAAIPPYGENGSGSTTDTVGATGDPFIDGLLFGTKWDGGSITYSDPDSPTDYGDGYESDSDDTDSISAQNEGFSQLNAAELKAMHFALNASNLTDSPGALGFSVSGFTNLKITYAGSGAANATIRAANSSDPATSYAYYPGDYVQGGDAWFGTAYDGTVDAIKNAVAGSYGWHTVLHELGHALGLKHGHETGGPGNTAMPAQYDSVEYSVMTYATYIGQDTSQGYTYEAYGAPQTYMMADIAALQDLYGANFSVNSGNTVYSWDPNTGETLVNGQAAIVPGGNRIFETIWDGGGTDTYDLSNYSTNLNIDLAPGGYSVFDQAQLSYLGGGPNNGYARGNVFNALQYQGDARSLIENANGGTGNDLISGNQANNVLTGNGGNDTLSGLTGNDTLNGGDGNDVLDGGAGNDRMTGGNGDDTYYVDSASDLIFETNGGTGGGYDTVNSSVNFNMAGNYVEALNLTGTANINGTGNSLNNVITGNSGNNAISGGAGNDTLVGGAGDDVLDGGTGNDRMTGGDGNDTYYVDSTSDLVFETSTNANSYNDIVQSTVSFSLAGNYIEVLNLYGDMFTPLNGTGNSLANTINGSNGDNVLLGMGGNDQLNGFDGNDTLDGGTGNDRMNGGYGNDTYYVDSASDLIFETTANAAQGGYDTVNSSVSFNMAGNYVEALNLTGTAAINGTGNSLDNKITGNAAVNTLSGGGGNDTIDGGLASDTLTGGAGKDVFVFSTALGASNVDTITDFTVGDDMINLDRHVFTAFSADATLASSAFVLGTAAKDSNDRILYDSSTGDIFYDRDGSGSAAAVLFAVVTPGTALTYQNFATIN